MCSYRLDYGQKPSTVVRFRLSGDDLQPDVITQALGISPSDAWAKHDPWPSPPGFRFRTRPSGSWSLTPASSTVVRFEEQMSELLDKLERLPAVLGEFVTMYNGGISVGYSSAEENYGFLIDRSTIHRLSKLNLWISFDLYSVNRDADTDDT
jgi:hypothetical protein